MTTTKMQAQRLYMIVFKTRDLTGHKESEHGAVVGRWTGAIDSWGKHTIVVEDTRAVLYLFEDEILSAMPVERRAKPRRHNMTVVAKPEADQTISTWPELGRCSDHKDRAVRPLACRTCSRIHIERAVVVRVVDALLACGYALATDEGEHRFYGETNPSTDRDVVLASLMQTDDEHLGVFEAKEATGTARVCKPFGWVRFVYGNDGYDTISDYTTNLDAALEAVNAWTDTLS